MYLLFGFDSCGCWEPLLGEYDTQKEAKKALEELLEEWDSDFPLYDEVLIVEKKVAYNVNKVLTLEEK